LNNGQLDTKKKKKENEQQMGLFY